MIPEGYEGRVTIIYRPDDVVGEKQSRKYIYDNHGVSYASDGVSYNWRQDKFFHYNFGLNKREEVNGEIEMSGSRDLIHDGRRETYYYVSGWVVQKPERGREKHTMNAIEETRKTKS